ncbi:MAG TPA: hypothetical protein VF190_15240, partial [Rhodothermales bacterium]
MSPYHLALPDQPPDSPSLMRSVVFVSMVLLLTACRGSGSQSTDDPAADTSAGPASTENLPEGTQSPVWDEARARGVDFRAVGQEPGWLLEIADGDSLRFLYDYGTSEVAAAVRTAQVAPGDARVYRAETHSGT